MTLWMLATAVIAAGAIEGGPPADLPIEADRPPIQAPAPDADEAQLTILPVPVPFLAMFGSVAYQNFKLGPARHDLSFLAGYFWSTNYLYDPTSTTPRPPGAFTADTVQTNTWRAVSGYTWRVTPEFGLGLDALVRGGGPEASEFYDKGLVQGVSALAGPRVQYIRLNDTAFPTAGVQSEATWQFGNHWGAENFQFQLASVDAVRYLPLATNQTLAWRGTARAGWPYLAWADKFSVGGGSFLRGYQWNRFTGDRLVSTSLEYRNLVLPDMLAFAGWKDPPLALGLAWTLFVDGGRAWESRVGVPVLSDLRYGGGTGFLLTLNRVPLARLDLCGSAEGAYPIAVMGASF